MISLNSPTFRDMEFIHLHVRLFLNIMECQFSMMFAIILWNYEMIEYSMISRNALCYYYEVFGSIVVSLKFKCFF